MIWLTQDKLIHREPRKKQKTDSLHKPGKIIHHSPQSKRGTFVPVQWPCHSPLLDWLAHADEYNSEEDMDA